ncbi:hypothetical protein FALBO_3996 [Fusarium albosuccineum]|uniref:Uncharacterized protein n=1 Tax=Fusarium albosuccineum TaxID=1237068 RepID=A0A8H4PE30_9HYPO|nr:hypothetical protein FALBO_3996 [Fusarium albosuccineum]
MKFSTILVSAFATLAAAAPGFPAFQPRAALNDSRDGRDGREGGEGRDGREGGRGGDGRDGRDGGRDGQLAFGQLDLNYLLKVNELDLGLFQTLGRRNNLNVIVFQELFTSQQFSLESLLQFQQLSTLLSIAGTGIFDNLDLSRLSLGSVNLGLIQDIGRVDLAQFIDQRLVPQITVIAQEITTVVIAKK